MLGIKILAFCVFLLPAALAENPATCWKPLEGWTCTKFDGTAATAVNATSYGIKEGEIWSCEKGSEDAVSADLSPLFQSRHPLLTFSCYPKVHGM